jgi:parallel beta-helix repeat protein
MYCVWCGTQLQPRARFCGRCGEKVLTPGVNQVEPPGQRSAVGEAESVTVRPRGGTGGPPPYLIIEVSTVAELLGAIDRSEVDSTIQLSGGTYVLEQPLHINKSLTLLGAGKDSTQLVCSAFGEVVRIDGSLRFAAKDITFRHEGNQSADVIRIFAGASSFERCCFTGAAFDDTDVTTGSGLDETDVPASSGLHLRGTATCTVIECEAIDNYNAGLLAVEASQMQVHSSTCIGNTYGLYYSDSASGTARKNFCLDNKLTGILITDEATPTIEANTCEHNKHAGIWIRNNVKLTIRNNTCCSNSTGISISENAAPIVDENVCRDNEFSGIDVCDGAAVCIVRMNRCENNSVGIRYRGIAGGTASQNQCVANKHYGIDVWSGEAVLQANVCTGNSTGIEYSGSAIGMASNNVCSDNRQFGISVGGEAQPVLEGNLCERNRFDGITYNTKASGTARQNFCFNNGSWGISVEDEAEPNLDANSCLGNRFKGIEGIKNT